jgi:nucleotide-binding universal stress UspA family protein
VLAATSAPERVVQTLLCLSPEVRSAQLAVLQVNQPSTRGLPPTSAGRAQIMNYQTILLAVDLAPEASVIDYPFALAEKLGAVVHTVHACPGGIVANPDSSEPISGEAAKEYVARELQRILAFHHASASMGKRLFHTSEPITAILKTAETVAADLIVVSTRARHGVARLITGSVAEGVLRDAKVPVLIMKSAARASQR